MVLSLPIDAKDCEKGADSASMVQACLVEEREKPVTIIYNQLIKALSSDTETIALLKKTQADWVTFKDSTCAFIEKTDTKAINSYTALGICQMEFNSARVKILKKYLSDAKSAK